MDWTAIASVLGERVEQPLAVLDRNGCVRLVNRAMEQVLGRSRFELDGVRWVQMCAPAGSELEAERWIGGALRGALRSFDVPVRTKTGDQVTFQFEFSLVGGEPGQGLLMSATHVVAARRPELLGPQRDLDYEIDAGGSRFGALVRLCASGDAVSILPGQDRCYEVLHGLRKPCADCPLLDGGEGPWPRIVVRHHTDSAAGSDGTSFAVTTAELRETGRARIRVRSVTEDALGAMQRARVDELAARAGLSPREREVLEYLLLGRNVEDMARLIGISPRTVKHHQASALQKLGAESRADLLRLLL